jgi:hypothetical protein
VLILNRVLPPPPRSPPDGFVLCLADTKIENADADWIDGMRIAGV